MSLDLELKVEKNNIMTNFFPVITRGESKIFNWDALTYLFVCEIYGLDISKASNIEQRVRDFEEKCKSKFVELLDDPRAWEHLYKIYFEEKNLTSISPKLLVYSHLSQIYTKSTEKRFLGLAKTILKSDYVYQAHSHELNFLEKIITDSFDDKFKTKSPSEHKFVNYFPNLSNIFAEDLNFLTKYSQYFIENIQNFIQIYMCIYTSQLSLTINSWRNFNGEHILECYFILDFEKASQERNLLFQRGYREVEKNLGTIFPIISMTESLQKNLNDKKPLWEFYKQRHDIDLQKLIKYCQDFADDRKLQLKKDHISTHEEAFIELAHLFKEQFSKNTDRKGKNDNVIKDIKNIILKQFVKTRGRSGSLFVLNQESLLLLTNLIIGEKEQLRLYELIKGFNKRGIFFDRESYKALVKFYERLGNVEKLSDSGDAIYVKKTI